MGSQRKVSVKWLESKQRWQVSFYWPGYKNAFRYTSWEVGGRVWSFTRENRGIADQYADYIRGQMLPDPQTGLCKFDPAKLSKQRKSKYAFRKYTRLWTDEVKSKVSTGDLSGGYMSALNVYISNYINPLLGEVSIYEVDTITVKDFYLKLSNKDLSKKHIQNIMDCLKQILKSAVEDINGLEMPKFPKYREKKRVKTHKFLLPHEQEKVIALIEPQHKAFAKIMTYGPRPSEVRNLRRDDLFFAEHEGVKYPMLHFETLKGGIPRDIPIDWDTYREIKKINPVSFEYLVSFEGKKYVRQTIYKALRRALNKAGFSNINPYEAFRHSRASQLNSMGATAFDIQYQLGHSDIRTSEIYTHVRVDEKYIRCISNEGKNKAGQNDK